jgi:hypothetical protein
VYSLLWNHTINWRSRLLLQPKAPAIQTNIVCATFWFLAIAKISGGP